jgi:hypothetical protein
MSKSYTIYEVASNKRNFCHCNATESGENKEETLFREIIRENTSRLKIDINI